LCSVISLVFARNSAFTKLTYIYKTATTSTHSITAVAFISRKTWEKNWRFSSSYKLRKKGLNLRVFQVTGKILYAIDGTHGDFSLKLKITLVPAWSIAFRSTAF
jgi:hypothetical protein